MSRFSILVFPLVLTFGSTALAFNDPTHGKPLLPWLWEDQFKPTIKSSVDATGLSIVVGGAAATVVAHQYDDTIVRHNSKGENLVMSNEMATTFGALGSGVLGVGIALGQLFLDQDNGLMHGRALALTSLTHVLSARLVERPRPNGRGDYLPFKSAFPSGHAASAFATAGSLAYAYGWKGAVPGFVFATGLSVARVSENAHWLSDVVAGAALGLFWAHASHRTKETAPATVTWAPTIVPGGGGLSAVIRF